MATDPELSPAVQAYRLEQARQRERDEKDDLDKGPEDTFPASDPVSHTITSVPTGRADPIDAERVKANSAVPQPRRRSCSVRGWIEDNLLAAVGIAATLGWIFGATR